LLDCLNDQERPATETDPTVASVFDAIHLPFSANVVLELSNQRQDAHNKLAGTGAGVDRWVIERALCYFGARVATGA
jgi:hypothetical protein